MLDEAYPAGRPQSRQASEGFEWTLEAVLYAVLLVGAAFVRFHDLGRWPLLSGEAAQALAAWRFLHAQGDVGGGAPFPFAATLAGFFAFGASDAVARLAPAILGTGLVLVPIALRRRLGTWGALAAAFMLAFSPTLVYYSRTLTGVAPALAGLGAVLVAVQWAGERQQQRARILGAAGLAAGLTSSAWVYTFLLAALVYYGLGYLAERRGTAWPGWAARREAGRALVQDRGAWGALVVPVALISTVALLRTGGVQDAANLLATWLGRLLPGTGSVAWDYPLEVLGFYELSIVLLGLGGLVMGLRRRDPWAGFLGLWALLAVLLSSWSGARDAEPVAFAILPLALLGGMAVTSAVSALRPRPHWAWVGVCLATLSVLLGFWWTQAALFGNVEVQLISGGELVLVGGLVLATPLVIAATVLAFYRWVGRAETTWAVTILGLVLAGAVLIRQGVSLNLRYARDPREPLVVAPTSIDMIDMTAFLEDWSMRKALDQHALSISVGADLEPLVTWYLRDFDALEVRQSPLADRQAGAIVMSADPQRSLSPGYTRTVYRLRTRSAAPLGTAREALGWWLLRVGGGVVEAESCELWVKP